MESVKRAFNEYGKQKEFNNIKKFKDLRSYEDRKEESDRIREKYPTRIPVIVEPYDHNVPMIDRKKFLVPDDLSFANFLYVIRKRIKLDPTKSLYLFVNGKIMNTSIYLTSVYDKHKDEDGFLYVVYSAETTFG
tara:strand:- start:3442 stop:3843 length:402 start_codon:yes stop_codon:yes gene_type:complete